MAAPHVFSARSDDGLVNVDHRHELGLLLEQLVQQRAVPSAEDEDLESIYSRIRELEQSIVTLGMTF